MQISVAEGLEDFDDDLVKGVGNILREGPPGGRKQFLRQGIQLPQIGKMPTALVGSRVELEVDLIIATDEADLERSAKVSNDQSFGHSHGKTEAKEVFVRRSVIEPMSRQAEFGPNGLGSGQQPLRQRTGAEQLAIFQRGQNIHVLRGPGHQPQGDERRPAADDPVDRRMVPDPNQFPQKAQSPVQRYLVKAVHSDILNTDNRCFNSLLRMPNGWSHGMKRPPREDFCCSQLGATKLYPPANELLLALTRKSASRSLPSRTPPLGVRKVAGSFAASPPVLLAEAFASG